MLGYSLQESNTIFIVAALPLRSKMNIVHKKRKPFSVLEYIITVLKNKNTLGISDALHCSLNLIFLVHIHVLPSKTEFDKVFQSKVNIIFARKIPFHFPR